MYLRGKLRCGVVLGGEIYKLQDGLEALLVSSVHAAFRAWPAIRDAMSPPSGQGFCR